MPEHVRKRLLLGVSSGQTHLVLLVFSLRCWQRPWRRRHVIRLRLLCEQTHTFIVECVFSAPESSLLQVCVCVCRRAIHTGVSAEDSWGLAVFPVSFTLSSSDAFEKQYQHNCAEMESFFFFPHCANKTKTEQSHLLKCAYLFMMVFA